MCLRFVPEYINIYSNYNMCTSSIQVDCILHHNHNLVYYVIIIYLECDRFNYILISRVHNIAYA